MCSVCEDIIDSSIRMLLIKNQKAFCRDGCTCTYCEKKIESPAVAKKTSQGICCSSCFRLRVATRHKKAGPGSGLQSLMGDDLSTATTVATRKGVKRPPKSGLRFGMGEEFHKVTQRKSQLNILGDFDEVIPGACLKAIRDRLDSLPQRGTVAAASDSS